MRIALTTRTDRVKMDELTVVAAALQHQVTRDFAPVWGIDAIVRAYPVSHIPQGWVPVIVQDTLPDPLARGLHRTAPGGKPFALVRYDDAWPVAASQEILELLVDPTCRWTVLGVSPMMGQGRAEILVHVCSPCRDARFGYAIDGIPVSDFCTPRYFDTLGGADEQYSFRDHVRRPFEILPGGAVTWITRDRVLWQALADQDGAVSFQALGPMHEASRTDMRDFGRYAAVGHHGARCGAHHNDNGRAAAQADFAARSVVMGGGRARSGVEIAAGSAALWPSTMGQWLGGK